METTIIAKKLSLLCLTVLGTFLATGCATPAYSAKERSQQIARNIDMEWKMAQDDIDDALLLRPMTTLSRWNIR